MKEPYHTDPLDALGKAYETLYEDIAKNFHDAENKTEPLFHKLVDEARNNIVKLKEISEQDAEKVTNWVKRDIADLANYLERTGYELKDWLGFEAKLIEKELLDSLLKAADRTTTKILEIKEKNYLPSKYHTGEVVGPGTLSCDKCDEQLHFRKTGRIPLCPKCHATNFHRYVT